MGVAPEHEPAPGPTAPVTDAEAGTAASGVVGAARSWSPGPRQRSALISWAAFTFTFGAVRGLTHAIRRGAGPAGDVSAGGVHLHHYLWGIVLLAVSGGVAVHGPGRTRAHPLVAAGYGAGGALVVDEIAVLVHLKDVYWKRSGKHSVATAIALIGGSGASFLFVPVWRKHLTEHNQ